MKKICLYVVILVGLFSFFAAPVFAEKGCQEVNLYTKNIGLVCGSHMYGFPKSDVLSRDAEKIVAIVSGEVKTFYLKKK